MSLINQMLKDLARRSKPLSSPDAILAGLCPAQISHKKNKAYYLLLAINVFLIFILGSFVIFYNYFFNYSDSPRIDKTQVVAHSKLTLKPAHTLMQQAEPTLPVTPTALTDVTLQVKDGLSNLRVFLSQAVLYRITSNEKNRFIITLENTQLTSNLPPIPTSNNALKMIRLANQPDGSLKIFIDLKEGAEVKYIGLNESDRERSSELRIDLWSNPMVEDERKSALQDLIQGKDYIKKLSSNDTTIDDEYQGAIQLIEQHKNQEAIAFLTKLLMKQPQFPAARKAFATLLINEGRLKEAQGVINTGLEQQPFYPPFIQLKAQLLVEQNQVTQALNLLLKAPPPIEKNPEYHAFIAALYQRENKSILAEQLYEQLVSLHPNNSIWWLGLGVARETLNKNQEALEAYAKANNGGYLNTELKIYLENKIHMLS